MFTATPTFPRIDPHRRSCRTFDARYDITAFRLANNGKGSVTKENANPSTGLNVGHHTGNARHFLIITLFPLCVYSYVAAACRAESMVENGRYWNATYDRAGETGGGAQLVRFKISRK